MIQEMTGAIPDLEAEGSAFVIDSPGKADWAVRKIKEERSRRDIYVAAARSGIDTLREKIRLAGEMCDGKTGYLLAQLDTYLDTTPAKATKTQISLSLPSGKLVRKLPSTDYERDDAKLLAWCRDNGLDDLVRVREEPAWVDVKRYIRDTGEIPDGVTPVERRAEFDVR